jgi:hypothetical protein
VIIRPAARDELGAINFDFEEIARMPTILGARANRESLVLFRAVRPPAPTPIESVG